MTSILEIISFLEKHISPLNRQFEWDNSGKQIYFGDEKICKVALALDPTAKAIKEAVSRGCELLITHHPLFFGSFKSLNFGHPGFNKVGIAIQNKLAILSYHTNFDLADYGLSDYICDSLGAKRIDTLDKIGSKKLYKFVVYAPKGYESSMIEAIDRAGGGSIGNYKKCSFSVYGTGTFEPQEGTKPFIGEKGKLEHVNEFKMETIVIEENLLNLIEEVRKAHPYEEMAYDVYKLENEIPYGIGRICEYSKSIDVKTFLEKLKEIFNINILRYNGNLKKLNNIDKFAVVAGSGATYWKKCKDKGVKLLITGDLKHHDALDAMEEDIAIIDVGHFASERIYLNYLSKVLKENFDIEIILLAEDDPINYV
ncbi:MAG: Nif3-like dinuclear metal center hexameric protein [Deferribacterota bacterium]|nr:Nif3-like dinuclear metal center hexameric protein [Deferribacterota bacterium]